MDLYTIMYMYTQTRIENIIERAKIIITLNIVFCY